MKLSEVLSPDRLKGCSEEELQQLAEEMRQCIIDTVQKNGGHLASNLGVVELTLALHRVFDCPKDKILFDVGHQCYAHKLLTGRYDKFSTLRQTDGLSGFPSRQESPCDVFADGHASTAISAAAGLCRARDLQGENHHVVAVVGDGAMTGGMCYEALNDAGNADTRLIVILNDNGMSIGPNVGGIARLLSHARMRPGYLRFKRAYRRFFRRWPTLYAFNHRIKERLKGSLLGSNMFEEMGFYYLGPVDGHDCAEVERILHVGYQYARQRRKHLTVVDKANVLASSRLWRKVAQEIAPQYPDVETDFMYVDNAAMRMIQDPKFFDVMVTENTFGDILTDEGSVITGSMGLLPSASTGSSTPVFEPIHGSWPQGKGLNIANPLAQILSVAMLYEYFDLKEEGALIREAVNASLAENVRTPEIQVEGAPKYGTREVGQWIVDYIAKK